MKKRKHVRKVTRVGQKSLCLVIPKEIIDEMGLQEKQQMVLYRHGKRIIIEDCEEK